MPHKFKVLTQNIHTLRLSVGGHTDGRTDARTENIYSIFRDKLLLLGEQVLALPTVIPWGQTHARMDKYLLNIQV